MVKRCKVFISYSHEDEVLKDSKVKKDAGYPRAFLSRLYAAIAAHDDLLTKDEIFFDDDRLAAEPAWRPAINTALDECSLLIFLVSPHSLLSEFCMMKELARAFQRGVDVITVLLRPSHDWYRVKVRNPATGESKALGEWHSGGVPKIGGNAEPVSKWTSEDDAWDNAMTYILDFIKANPFESSDKGAGLPEAAIADEPVARMPIEVVQPDRAESALCNALRRYLEQHWEDARLYEVFSNTDLILGVALPVSPDKVMRFATDVDGCCANLVETVACLRCCKGNPDFGGHVEGALVRAILVVAETYLRSEALKVGYRPGHDEPVWEQEILMASLIAAERMGFGLCFKGGKREPESVFEITPPAMELGNLDEGGPALVRSEVMRAFRRIHSASDNAVSEGYLTASVRRLRRELDADIVVTTLAEGNYLQPEARMALQALLGRYEIHTFFRSAERQAVPKWAIEVIGDLQNALAEAFPRTKDVEKEQAMVKPENGGVVPPVQFNGPVNGPIIFGDHAKAAGRDLNIGNPADWEKVTQALQSLHDTIAAVAEGAPQKTRLLDDLKEVSTAIATGKPVDADAKLVKRCLEGLKQGAEAVDNGGKIVERLAPVWDGLKAAWPAFLALMS